MNSCSKCGVKCLHTYCKVCKQGYDIEYSKVNSSRLAAAKIEYRKVNHHRISAAKAEYRLSNRGKIAAHKSKYYQENNELIKKTARGYYQANRTQILEKRAEYYQTPVGRGVIDARNAIRRARKKNAPGSYTWIDIEILLELNDEFCCYCNVDISNSKYHIDHKLPISRGGSNYPDNIALACVSCNLHKGAMTDREFIDRIKREINANL